MNNTINLIKAVQTGRHALRLTDEEYRALLGSMSDGKTSTKELNESELKKVLLHMRKLGFIRVTEHQLNKIRSLWFQMHDQGIVRSGTEQSIAAYIRRITRKEIKACTVKDLQRVIETMKKWIERMDDPSAREHLLQILMDMPPESRLIQ